MHLTQKQGRSVIVLFIIKLSEEEYWIVTSTRTPLSGQEINMRVKILVGGKRQGIINVFAKLRTTYILVHAADDMQIKRGFLQKQKQYKSTNTLHNCTSEITRYIRKG